MPQFVRRLNRWLLFLILLALCAFPIQFLFASKFKEGGLSFSFGMPTDDIVLMLHSNTAYVGRYLVPIDERENKASPYQQSGETLVPARFLASKLEAELAYDEATGTITFTKDEARVTYRLNKPEVKIAGATSSVKTAPHVKNGLTYVPLRPVSEALGRNIYARTDLSRCRSAMMRRMRQSGMTGGRNCPNTSTMIRSGPMASSSAGASSASSAAGKTPSLTPGRRPDAG